MLQAGLGKNNQRKKAGGVAQAIEYWPCKHEVLVLICLFLMIWCWLALYSYWHLCIFLEEMSVAVIGPFFNQVVLLW
jgi:hypothetical protein